MYNLKYYVRFSSMYGDDLLYSPLCVCVCGQFCQDLLSLEPLPSKLTTLDLFILTLKVF